MRFSLLFILPWLLLASCSKYEKEMNLKPSTTTPTPAPAPVSPVVAHYAFENDWLDTLGAHDGTPVATTSPTFTTDKYRGNAAADLSANDARVSLGDSTALTPANLTVSFWLKRTAPSSGVNNTILWAKPCQWDHADGFYVQREGVGKAITLVVSGGNFIALNGDPDVVFALNAWSHVAATYDSTRHEGHIYVNGVDQPLTLYGTPLVITPSTATKFLGSCAAGSKIEWPLDELTIMNSSLSASEVQALYQSQL